MRLCLFQDKYQEDEKTNRKEERRGVEEMQLTSALKGSTVRSLNSSHLSLPLSFMKE
jgi:hypothetical protein